MAVEISMEGHAKNIQERNNDWLEILKAKEFENLQHPTMLQEVEDYDANKLMDLELYDAAIKGDADNFINTVVLVSTDKNLSLSTIFGRVSPSGNSLLHEAARFGKKEIVELIAHHFPFLLTRTNIVGDTALHVATKAEKSNIIDVLIKVIPREDTPGGSTSSNDYDDANVNYQLLRMKNEIGNTALHEAVINGDLDGVKCLFSADNQVAHHLNMEGKSPLRLAVETSNKDILLVLLEARVGDGELVGRPREESPVYAAITRKKLDMLEEMKKRPMLFHIRDEKGKTALHLAASIGYLEGVRFLLRNFCQSALERSKKGDFPIHMASKKGHVEIVKELLQQQYWPDPTELLNNEGQNILHVAAKNGRKGLVQYILRNPKLEKLLNAKDKNGNTPLHLASMNLHPNVLVSLTWDKRVDLKLREKGGFTAMDLLEQRGISVFHTLTITESRKLLTGWVLNSAGTPHRGRNMRKKPPTMERIKDGVNLLALIAILVATVTFAAGFTVPGGFNDHQGVAALVNRKMFQVFIISNTIATYCSIIATFILVWAPLGDFHNAASTFTFALLYVSIALFAMSLAFMSAVYLVVSKLTWLASVVLIMGIIFTAFIFGLHILLRYPFGFPHPVIHFICHYTIPLMILITGSFGELFEGEKQKKSQPVKGDKQDQDELQEVKEDKQLEK